VYRTPPLEPGRDFSYTVTAVLKSKAPSTKTISVRAFGTTNVDFGDMVPGGDGPPELTLPEISEVPEVPKLQISALLKEKE
jgi:hypothetical protein